MFERLRFWRRERTLTPAELQGEFKGIEPVTLKRLSWGGQGERVIAVPSVELTPSSITLYQSGSYKGKEANWKAHLVVGAKVVSLNNFQGEVAPEHPLRFSLPEGSSLGLGEPVHLYYQVRETTIEGRVYPGGKWVYTFAVPSLRPNS